MPGLPNCSKICEEQGITVRFDNDIVTPSAGEVYVEHWDDYAWLTIARGRLTISSSVVKRLLDLVGSTIALIILAPVLLGIAVATKNNFTWAGFLCPGTGRSW